MIDHLPNPGTKNAHERDAAMRFSRSSGILLHPTSLPGPYGIGDLGPEARRFVDFLAAAGQTLWQVLPLGPTGYGDSPYQCFSAIAGSPLLISLEDLGETAQPPEFPECEVDFARVIPWKLSVLEVAARKFRDQATASQRESFETFCTREAAWLDDFALFMALKLRNQTKVWTSWEPDVCARDPRVLAQWQSRLQAAIETQKFMQWVFFSQWNALREYARERGIRIMGDLPIYVAHDSADVWSDPHHFQLDPAGNPIVVAGVPPDYFSATGQLWGNPIYAWDVLEAEGYRWWMDRFRAVLQMVDMIRLDHFRGFEAYWEVPMPATTAEHGRWVKGPGSKLFRVAKETLGDLPLVAENLGVITPEVEAIRHEFGFPGMSILQFGFGNDPQGPSFRPHNYPREVVAYTGTHDCDTTVGWWTSAGRGEDTRTADDIRRERDYTRRYFNSDGREIHWVFIRALLASVADTVLIPLQDVLGLGSEARMNQPATLGGNWRWRYSRPMLTDGIATRLREIAELYERR
ncbi:MAG TPA: 4-alpha-glucanotransferase [Bryobacteraceae bacterium]|jgi:4-alpha-glucanotransferase